MKGLKTARYNDSKIRGRERESKKLDSLGKYVHTLFMCVRVREKT